MTALAEAPRPSISRDDRAMEYTPFGSDLPIKLTLAIVRNQVAARTRSGAVPDDRDLFRFMMMCHAGRLNPFAGDAYLVGYDAKDGPVFTLITAHQAFLKRAEANPNFDGMKSGVIVMRDGQVVDVEGDFTLDGDKLLGGWATVYRKNLEHQFSRRVKLGTFKKQTKIWDENPAGMICKVAEADSLRSAFPTMLGGLYNDAEGGRPLNHEVVATVDTPSLPAGNGPKAKALAEKAKGLLPQSPVAESITGGRETGEATPIESGETEPSTVGQILGEGQQPTPASKGSRLTTVMGRVEKAAVMMSDMNGCPLPAAHAKIESYAKKVLSVTLADLTDEQLAAIENSIRTGDLKP